MTVSRRTFLKASAAAAVLPTSGRRVAWSMERAPVVIRVLGVAQDGGVPQLGCTCERCRRALADPAFRRSVASIGIITEERHVYLIDATPDVRTQVARLLKGVDRTGINPRNPIDGIFLTHAHMGHYTGLMHFGFESLSSDRIPVFCTASMADFLRTNAPWDLLVSKENIALSECAPEKPVTLPGEASVLPVPVPHRQEYTDTVGFVISANERSLLYIPDIDRWNEWTDDLPGEFSKYDFVMIDGTFYSGNELRGRDMTKIPHPPIARTMEMLKGRMDLRKTKIYFTHFNHTNPILDPDGKTKKHIAGEGFHCAEEGMEIVL